MTELLTAAQMRAIEQAAIASGEVTGLELMERAGRGVVEAILEEWPEMAKTSQRAVVLCGPGNNGGDGFVVARLLRERGWEVEVFLYADAERLPPDARVNYERWGEMGEVNSISYPEFSGELAWKLVSSFRARESALIFDAVFGTGLTRPICEGLRTLFQVIDMELRTHLSEAFKLIAIDIPSGHCADSGIRLSDSEFGGGDYNAFNANLTVTFHAPKRGHYLDECPEYCGNVRSIGIGLTKLELDSPVNLIGYPGNNFGLHSIGKISANKFQFGHALVLSGLATRTGAARLAARGALRIGAGLVTVAAPAAACPEHAAQLNAIMLHSLGGEGIVEGLEVALEDDRINALCVGPGLGLGVAGDLVGAALGSGRAIVLDADALTAIARCDDLFKCLHDKCVLTPHGGEFARLFPDIAEKLAAPATKGPAYSKVDATREAAARAGCVVLYKGADTVIADPSGRCSINSAHYDRAAPWLATAGSGDVLAGFITGLLARGFSPMAAAETGAWLNVECARKFGPGLIAEDLPEQLPAVFRDLVL